MLSVVDGAHAPGQVPLDLDALGADIYAGNCHKWLCAPKGAGFLWAHPEQQGWIEPLVVSWGYREGADFAERHGWAGTRDPAAYLTVPKAIDVHATFDLERAESLADDAERRLDGLGYPRVEGVPSPFMRAVELPPGDPDELWATPLRRVPCRGSRVRVGGTAPLTCVRWGRTPTNADIDRLVSALEELL